MCIILVMSVCLYVCIVMHICDPCQYGVDSFIRLAYAHFIFLIFFLEWNIAEFFPLSRYVIVALLHIFISEIILRRLSLPNPFCLGFLLFVPFINARHA